MGHQQKGKNKKRRKSWHRGGVEARKFKSSIRRLGSTTEGIDYTQAAPKPLTSHTSKSQRRN
jgi:hypothetical protein